MSIDRRKARVECDRVDPKRRRNVRVEGGQPATLLPLPTVSHDFDSKLRNERVGRCHSKNTDFFGKLPALRSLQMHGVELRGLESHYSETLEP